MGTFARNGLTTNKTSILILIFLACYQAFCEFIDNAIQATNENEVHNETREIVLHLYLKQVSESTVGVLPTQFINTYILIGNSLLVLTKSAPI